MKPSKNGPVIITSRQITKAEHSKLLRSARVRKFWLRRAMARAASNQ